ncbi:MAG TPA: hypothetical protein EYP02_07185 [Sulfurovum sp.]|nr:hypothetical protein [Sulfurovum sp.]
MKFILLSISIVILTGCFNTKSTEEKVISIDESQSKKKEPFPKQITAQKVKTYTREELLQRRLNKASSIPHNTYTNTPEYYSQAYTPSYTTYSKDDFVSEDLEPVQNNAVQQSELKNYIDNYFEQLQTLNTDGIVSMTYPKFFKPINESLFRQYINTILSSSQISVDSFKTNLIYLGDVYPYQEGEFAQIIYQSDITLNFLNPELYNDELSVRVLNNVLVNKYGQENIKINPTQRTINIKKEEKLLAIKERNEEWKFIGDNPSYRRYYPSVLPAGILSQI